MLVGSDWVVHISSLSLYLDLEFLKAELDCLPDYSRVYYADQPIPIKSFIKISTICNSMDNKPCYKISLSNVCCFLSCTTQ